MKRKLAMGTQVVAVIVLVLVCLYEGKDYCCWIGTFGTLSLLVSIPESLSSNLADKVWLFHDHHPPFITFRFL